jgi:hypothetical protein
MLNDGSGNINVPSLTIRGGADGKKGVTIASAGEYKLSIDASGGIFLNGPIIGNNNFFLKSINKADESVYIYCDSDATDKKKCNIIGDLIYITGKTHSQGLLTAQSGINFKNSMVCNDNTIFFRPNIPDGKPDTNHGINYNGTFNGPILYGYLGGALGLGPTNDFKTVLVWNHEKNVTMKGSLTVDGIATMQAPLTVNGTLTAKSGIESQGLTRALNVLHVLGGLHLGGSGTMVCNGIPILFKNEGNFGHGIQCNIGAYDGPCLFGHTGGALGVRPSGVYTSLLQWDNNNVIIERNLVIRNSDIKIYGIQGRLFFENTNSEMRHILMGYNRIENGTIMFGNKVDFWVNGSVQANKQPSVSDYRLKKNVKDIDEFTTLNLRPVQYDMYEKPEDEEHRIGLIAHEVQEIIPFIVSGVKDGPNYQAISYTDLIPILIKDFQRLHKQNTEQESRIAKLESQISFLMSRIA